MTVEALDAYTIGHSRRVARHAERIARELSLPEDQVRKVRAAAAVHDVGKVFTPRAILNKPSTLTAEEYEEVKNHCEDGAAIVSCLEDPELTAIVRYHHERLDGTGYPAGLAGDAIPLGARIVAVADTYDAIIEIRPYRKPASHNYAIGVLREEMGSHLDPVVVEAFLRGYAGRRALVLWTVLAVLPQRIIAFGAPSRAPGAGSAAAALRRPASAGRRAATGAIAGALVAASFAAGGATVPKARPPAIRAASSSLRAGVIRHLPRHRKPHHRHHTPPARRPASTCLAYNPQLCAVVGIGRRSGRVGTPGSGGSAPYATTGTLPFTGFDPGRSALVGLVLALFGLLVRLRVSSPRRRASPARTDPGGPPAGV